MGMFDSHGFFRTTMEEIAAGAGISKGSIYNYFKSKTDLFNQLFAESIVTDEEEVDRLVGRRMSATEKLLAVVDLWVERLPHYQRVGRLTLEFWATAAREQRDGELAVLLEGIVSRWLTRIGRTIAEGQRRGEFHTTMDPAAAARLFMGVTDGLMIHLILKAASDVDEPLVASLKQFVLAGLEAAPEAGAASEQGE
jgi:AcrR family transcriptional regulator